jgi:methanogenic corrinoid protein MtbC1
MSSGRERFAFVGMSKSGDLCNLLSSAGLRSNFIIYEDAADYTQLWAKEVQSDTYVLQFEFV